MLKHLLTGAAPAAVLIACTAAAAQTTPPSNPTAAASPSGPAAATNVAELVVTATKRRQAVVNVPGPVTAITGAQINALHMNETRDMLTLVPTAFMQEINAGTARDISIRGIGTEQLFGEPGVAMYVDDVFSNDFISYPTQFYDLERVEVLRGPQGGLYGRDAVGGVINFISQQPTPDLGGYLRASYGNWERYELEGVANLPLDAQSGMRILAWRTNQYKGEYYNAFLHKWIDKNDSTGGRIVYHRNLTDRISVNLIGEVQDGDGPGTNLFFPASGETKTTIMFDTEPRNHFNTNRLAAEVTWDTDAGTFTFVGGYRDYWLHGVEDTDLSAVASAQIILNRTNHVRSYYGEARFLSHDFGPLNVMAGIDFLDSDAVGDLFSNGVGTAALVHAPFTLTFANGQSLKSWAPFVEGTLHITRTLTLIGDLRYTNDQKHVDFVFTPSPEFTLLVPSFTPASEITTRTFSHTSPGVTLAWQPDDNWRLYAKVQSGFRAGGFNFNVAKVADLPYDQETFWNYEIGVKRRIPTGYVALTGYLLRQSNVLTPEFDLSVAGSIGSYLANTGAARNWGVEAEGSIAPLPGLTLTANAGWLDSKFTSGTATFYGNLAGKEPFDARPFTASVVADYRRPLIGDTDLLFNGSYSYRASGWGDAANTFPLGELNLLNLDIGVDLHHRVEITAYGENLLNSTPVVAFGGFRPPNSTGVQEQPGRQYGIQVKAKF
ncbi:MAG TPA: TonB-dependent receptor [Caulobacteraceae bacterium]|nr:TonB-dependent receptor [Caulobacteraceae bacterium]